MSKGGKHKQEPTETQTLSKVQDNRDNVKDQKPSVAN